MRLQLDGCSDLCSLLRIGGSVSVDAGQLGGDGLAVQRPVQDEIRKMKKTRKQTRKRRLMMVGIRLVPFASSLLTPNRQRHLGRVGSSKLSWANNHSHTAEVVDAVTRDTTVTKAHTKSSPA